MANFEKALSTILQNEGGYVNDKTDKGGETKYGISKRSYPKEDIKNLTIERAKEIYKSDFWDKVKGDHIQNDELALNLFDFAVNAGVGTSIKTLQKALNVHDDGILGDQTLSAMAVINFPDLIKRFVKFRNLHYVDIVIKDPAQIKYLKGWISRSFL